MPLYIINSLKVSTHYDPKPIPARHLDWSAVDYGYGGEGCSIGYGKTEADAIADLLEEIEQRALEHVISTTNIDSPMPRGGDNA